MMKKVRRKTGIVVNAALVAVGWLSFIVGQVIPDLFVKCVLLSIARVLPHELSTLIRTGSDQRKALIGRDNVRK
jgi:hypothetical protein